RSLLLNAGGNGLAFAAHLAVAFFLAPYLVRALGKTRYGIWAFVESYLAYFTLFDLGIAATLVRYVPKYRAEGDGDRLNRVASASLLVFTAAGAAVFALGLAAYYLVLGRSSAIPDELRSEAGGMALVSIAALAASLPLSLFPAVLDGLNRFAAKSLVRVGFLAAKVVAIVLVVNRGGTLVHLAAVH